jgi:dihydroorotate dehydrogenase
MKLAAAGFSFLRPVLHGLDAETAHRATITALKLAPTALPGPGDTILETTQFGLRFPNPLGLAAGFDKNGEVPQQMLGLGFGFVEVGTTTPLPQSGNPRPRLFRLPEERAVINRMGFNNDGHEALYRRLMARTPDGIAGVNIGANKDAPDRIADYVAGVNRFGAIANYLTVNISSPNTPGLRGLQSRDELNRLLDRLGNARSALAKPGAMLLKIAPDLAGDELADVAACCVGRVDGVIISNTTISRPASTSRHVNEAGGLSGVPLFDLATRQLAQFYLLTEGRMPLVGVGGISSAETAWTKLEAGASLLQLYSALVYQGPELIGTITRGLADKLRVQKISRVADIVGREAERIAYHTGPGT